MKKSASRPRQHAGNLGRFPRARRGLSPPLPGEATSRLRRIAGSPGISQELPLSFVRLPESPIRCKNLVGGAFVDVVTKDTIPVTSPWTGAVIGEVPMSRAADVDTAVALAKKASVGWAATPLRERCQVLYRFRDLVLRDLEMLAHRAASEAGKTVAEARAGILKGVEVTEFATALQNIPGGSVMEVSRGVSCEIRREPLGVVAGIVPFNFPAMVPLWMIPNALALGNSFVLKPSEKVPLTAQLLGALLAEAGLPEGVFSLVNGGVEAVDTILDHPDIQAVGFVGSTAIARKVYERGSKAGKRVLALGGAKNHLIVTPDADVDMTARAVLDSFTGCAGQRCMAASVLLAVGDIEPVLAKVEELAKNLALGSGMGAIIDRGALERLEAAIGRAEGEGAKLLVDGRGKKPSDSSYTGGNWLGATLLDGVRPDSEAGCQELFGPILAVVRVKNVTEALQIENANRYGNACSVFTTNGAVAEAVAAGAKAAMIGVNVGVPVPREPFSFGGMGESKFGHGDITGPSSIDFWTHNKKITRKWAPQDDQNWMS